LRTLHSFATLCVFGAALAALLPACGSTDNGTPAASAGAPGTAGAPGAAGASGAAGAATATGDVTKGSAVYAANACGSCHGADASGDTAPNITQSKTAGIGNWTYAQFQTSIRTKVRPDGTMNCFAMFAYSTTDISDASLLDLYAFLKSKPVVDVAHQGILCPKQ